MTAIVKGEHRKLTLRQQKGRSVNAVAEVLQKKLLAPNIYLEPRSSSIAADVLAVDRAGAGDLHAVKIKLEAELMGEPGPSVVKMLLNAKMMIRRIHRDLMRMPAHYRYLGMPRNVWDGLKEQPEVSSYSPDGIGRIRIISITDRGEELPSAEIVIAPERFRVDGAKLSSIEKNLINNKKCVPI